MNYTRSTRNDGCWDVDQECADFDKDPNEGPIEVFALNRLAPKDGLQRRTYVCEVTMLDMADGGNTPGNLGLIIAAPRMYESLKRAAEVLRFMLEREKEERAHGIHRELLGHVADAEATLRQVERVAELCRDGEHIA